jgi:hypothetical protein
MFDVLKELGIAFDDNLNFLVERAAEVHQLRGRAERDPVSRSSMLYAAATIEPLVLTLLETSGLHFAAWERSLGFDVRPELAPPSSRQPAGFEVSPEGRDALKGYFSISPKRVLDPLGVAAAFLMRPAGPIERHLFEAGLHIDQAASRARLFMRSSLNHGAVDPATADFSFSPLADAIIRDARRHAAKQQVAFEPLTTTQVFIATITSTHAEPSNAAWFLRTFVEHVLPDGWQNAIDDWMASYVKANREPSRLLWSQPLTAIIERARCLARDARRDGIPEISARHLVGALIASRRWAANCGIPELIAKLKIDSNELIEKYFSYLEETPTPSARDDLAIWRNFLGIRQESFVPRFDAEGFGGADLLNISENVNAFASLLASNKIDPPLSIGLFGDWGSGKSFFMARMREEIAERARRATGQEDCVFYSRIVQIDFNAWHYVEANLWASLVEHLFRNLKLTHEKPNEQIVKERREGLLQKVDTLMAERVAAEAAVQKAEIDRDRAAETLQARKSTAEARAAAAKGLQERDVWDLVKIDAQTRLTLQTCLEQLGVGSAVRSNEELRKTFDNLRDVSTRTRLQFAWLFRQPRAIGFLLLLLVAAPFGAAGIIKLLRMYQPQLADVSAAVIRFASYAGVVTAWLTNRLGSGKAILDRIDKAREAIDEKIETAENVRKQSIADAERALTAAVEKMTNAKADLEQNEKQVASAKQALLELTNSYRLTRFIDERAGSDDYRKLLGVLATVRNDFSALSELMYPLDRKSDLSDALHIERIILYIDDLDRCDPDRVVDVLQAVHLLLAFKLFVVVVGVDARWVYESLRQKHTALRGKNTKHNDPNSMENGSVPGYAVEPHDYLEKIFQVPFWLDQMQPQSTMNYIGSLLAEDLELDNGNRRLAAADPPLPTADGIGSAEVTQSTRTAAVWHTIDDSESAYTDPKQLTIRRKELEYMSGELIASLVKRSPRTAKRYVNTYRFFRASLPKETMEAYLTDATPPPYRCALMMLAIIVGVPEVSLEVLAQMESQPPAMTTLEFASLVAIGDKNIEQWETVKAALIAFENGKSPLAPLLDQLPRVVRYSFRAPARMRKATKPDSDRIAIRDIGSVQSAPKATTKKAANRPP